MKHNTACNTKVEGDAGNTISKFEVGKLKHSNGCVIACKEEFHYLARTEWRLRVVAHRRIMYVPNANLAN